MTRILVLTREAPFPLQANGASLRANPMLEQLARTHEVDLTLVDERRGGTEALPEDARSLCREVFRLPRPKVGRPTRLTRTAIALLDPGRPPWEHLDPCSEEQVPAMAAILKRGAYDVLFAVYGVFDLVVRLRRRGLLPPRVVIDWVDAPSLDRARDAAQRSGVGASIVRSRVRRMQAWQCQLNQQVDAAIYIAQTDLDHSGCGGFPNMHVIPNGVLRKQGEFARPQGGPPTIGFLGNMSYRPNVEAAVRLHDRIFRPLAESRPGLRMKIVGREPDPEVLSRAGERVEVTGEVDSIWPHLAGVDVMVFPMSLGAGLQNKVLEALEARCAVVVTPIGAAGLGKKHLGDLVLADTDEEIRAAVCRLLDDPEAMARARDGGDRVRAAFDWDAILPRFEAIVTGAQSQPPSVGG